MSGTAPATGDPAPVQTIISTTFSTTYSADGETWTVGPDIEIGSTLTGDGPGAQSTPFVNVYGCGDGDPRAAIEFITQGLAAIGTNGKTETLQISFLSTGGFAPSCAAGDYAFPVPFGPRGNGVGRVTYDQAGTGFAGTVYDAAGKTAYTLKGTSVSFKGV